MKIEDVKVGMRLRNSFSNCHPNEKYVVVSDITEKGFKYTLCAGGYSLIPRLGTFVKAEGHECFSKNGEILYEPAGDIGYGIFCDTVDQLQQYLNAIQNASSGEE